MQSETTHVDTVSDQGSLDSEHVPLSARAMWAHLFLTTALSFLLCSAYIKRLEPLYPNTAAGQQLQVHVQGVAGRGLIYDENDYVRGGMNLAQGQGYALQPGRPTALRQPLYSLYLAGVFKLSNVSVKAALIGNALLVSLLPLMAFLIATPLFGGDAGIVAAYLCVLNPSTYYFGVGSIYSEALFGVLLCGATAMWLKSRSSSKNTMLLAVGAGVLYGAALLTRSGYLLLPLGLLAGEILMRAPRKNVRAAMVVCVIALATLAPWALRNKLALGTAIINSTNDGTTLLGSVLAAREGRGDWENPAAVSPEYARVQFMPDEVARTKISRRMAVELLKETSFAQLARVALKRVARVWIPVSRIVPDEVGRRTNIILSALYLPVMLLGAYGWLRILRSGREAVYRSLPLWMTAFYCTAISAAVWGSTRFRFPLEPMLAAVAGYGCVYAFRMAAKREPRTSEAGVAA